MFLDHTQRRSTVGRTPLDEWSARRKDLYLTTHNIHNRQTFMPPVGFEPTISAGERPQTYALDRAATGTSIYIHLHFIILCGPWENIFLNQNWALDCFPDDKTPLNNTRKIISLRMVNLVISWQISFLFHCSAFSTLYMLKLLLLRRSVWRLFMKVQFSE